MQLTTTCSADCEDWSERSLPLRSVGGFQHPSNTSVLGCVHPQYEGLHRGLLPRRGPSVRPAPLVCHRSSCLSRLVSFTFLVSVIRNFSSRVLMTFSLFLVIVTCFALSFARRSDATARLILDASLLHCTRAAVPTLLNCADQSFCWMRPSLLTWLCTSLSAGFASVWWSFLARATSTSGTVSSAAYPCCVELFTLSYQTLSQARRLEICNIEPGDCAAVCSRSRIKKSGPYCESSSGSSVLLMACVESLQFSARS